MKLTISLLKLIVGLVFSGMAYFFAPGDLVGPARRMLSLFVLVAWLWITEAFPIYIVALLVPFLEVVLGILDQKTALAPFFHPVVALLLGGFMLSAAVSKYSLDRRIARLIVARAGRRPWGILLAVMATTAFLSMWLSNTATTAIMVAIAAPIVASLPQKDRFRKGILLAIPFSANVGGMGTPVGSTPNPMAISYLLDKGIRISFVDWMAIAVPLQVIYLAIIAGVVYALFRPRVREMAVEIPSLGESSRKEMAVLGVGAITVLLWLTSRFHGVPDSIIALIPAFLLLGSGLLGVQDFRGIRWEVLILIGGGLALGVGMQKSGLSRYIVENLRVEALGMVGGSFIFFSLTALLTTFMSNTATAALLIPVVGMVGSRLGLEAIFVIGIGVVASLSMALPVSTPPNAIAYGHGGIRVKDMALAGGVVTALGVAVTALLGTRWWVVLGYGG